MERVRRIVSHFVQDSQLSTPLQQQASSGETNAILAGVRIVELATVIAGPTCAALLADMGADVIKVEPPEGDPWRFTIGVNPKTGLDVRGEKFSSGFEMANRGKRSIIVDLNTPDGKATMNELLSTADIFLTNVRLKALQKLGLDYQALQAKMPTLIYAHLTAWGVGGPKENDAGYDVGAFWAASGVQKYIMANDEKTTQPPRFIGAMGDHTTAIHLMTGILGALYHRKNTGKGQYVEGCIYRAGVFSMAVPMVMALAGAAQGRRIPAVTRSYYPNPTFNVFQCRDGIWIQLLGLDTMRHFGNMLACLGIEETIKNDPRFTPVGEKYKNLVSKVATDESVRLAFNNAIDAAFAQKNAEEWEQIFTTRDLWHHRVADFNDVAVAPNATETGTYVDIPGVGHKLLAHPVKWSAAPAAPRGRAPNLGAHTEEVLAELKSKRN